MLVAPIILIIGITGRDITDPTAIIMALVASVDPVGRSKAGFASLIGTVRGTTTTAKWDYYRKMLTWSASVAKPPEALAYPGIKPRRPPDRFSAGWLQLPRGWASESLLQRQRSPLTPLHGSNVATIEGAHIEALQLALEKGGVEFIAETGGGRRSAAEATDQITRREVADLNSHFLEKTVSTDVFRGKFFAHQSVALDGALRMLAATRDGGSKQYGSISEVGFER